ncbi:MarR family winged helix-turn-helix transcriptional regulator [Oscillibacter sp. ER4]|uniref:MarR family winged helix-turn-helix transcriptional regulator n=1 Tax=Oscillibacter sp. ER4 TaxID=1519439 RepID=UPI00068D1E0B|nr:MarR family transcriptional regulator [Oscillibacter sp. ER4]
MMPKEPMRGATLFSHANKMTKAYHVMLTPLCKEAGLPPLALDILLFLANNPEHNTAKDICRLRGHKPGIVSVHVERLVNDGLLERREMPGDRRQTRLVCTEKAQDIITRGRDIQWQFGLRLMEGISKEDHETMHRCFERIDVNLDEICKGGR